MKNANKLFSGVAFGLASMSALFAPTEIIAQNNKPNLLYIFPDQYRLHALSIWSNPEYRNILNSVGDPVQTPNLDKLAKQGVIFTQVCSTHPVSSPHRAMLMTGMFPHDNGVEDLNCYKGRTQGVHDEIECLTDVIAKAGYETAYVGKTHWERTEPLFDADGNYVGTQEAPGGNYVNPFDTYIPEGKGRHSNKFWFQDLRDDHFDTRTFSNQPELVGGKKDGDVYHPRRFSPALEADVVIKYLKNEYGERDASKPFSMIWSINPPHNPYSKITDCDVNIFNQFYRDLKDNEVLLRKNVKVGEGTQFKDYKTLAQTAKVYFSLVTAVDAEIGRVLKTLDEKGLSDNTIVVFTSDHGEMMGSHGVGGKNYMSDESFLVPFIIRYPGNIKPQVSDLMFGSTDIMPTMLGMMGLHNMIPQTVAGTDYSKGIMTGDFKGCAKPLTQLYLRADCKGVRSDRYSYQVNQNGTYVLYDNKKDPYQLSSIKLEDISKSEALLLKKELGKWLTKAHDNWSNIKKNRGLIIY